MKKLVFAAVSAALATTFIGSVPAQAQSYYNRPNGNDQNRYQEATDPGYDLYRTRSGGSYYGYGPNVFTALPCLLFCSHSRKPKDGELRTLPDGTSVSWDKRAHRWVTVNEPATQPRHVYADRDVYMAQ